MILCLHEEVAISIAHGYAKATGEACPVLMHDLVGLMNGSMAVYNAFCDQAPVLIIGGGGPGFAIFSAFAFGSTTQVIR